MLLRVGHDWVTFTSLSEFPGKSHGQRKLAEYSPWGYKNIRYNLTTKQQTITTKQWPFFALDTFLFLKFVLPEINIVIYAFFWIVQWQPTPVLLPGKSHGQRNLVGCNPWGHSESDTTEWLHFPFSLSCIGEGNGNPLQCFCLENPRDGGAWWAAIYGVTQSQT